MKSLTCSVLLTMMVPFMGISQKITLTAVEQEFIASHPTIVFGGDPDWEPMIIIDDQGGVTGLERELLDEIELITGLEFEIKAGVWAEMVQLAEAKKIDGLLYTSPQPQREKDFRFSKPYNQFQVGFYSRFNQQTLSDTSELEGKKVGVQASDQFCNNYLDGIQIIEKVTFTSRSQMIQALLAEEIDFMFGALDFNYYLWKNTITGIKLVYLPEHPGFDVVYSIRKDYKPLLSIINKAIDQIGQAKRLELVNRWLQMREFADLSLLSKEEKLFLESNKELTILTVEHWLPIIKVYEDGQVSGLVGDYLKLVETKLGVKLDIISGDDSTTFKSHESIPSAVYVYPDLKSSRPDFYYSDPFLSIPYGLAMRKGSPFFNDIRSLGKIKVGVLDHNPHYDEIKAAYPNLILVPVTQTSVAMDRIMSGELHGYIGSISTLNYRIQSQGYSDLFIAALTDFSTELHFSSNSKLAVDILSKATSHIPDGEKQALIKKWYGAEGPTIIDTTLALQIGGIAVFLLAIMFGWIYSLRRLIRKRSRVQQLLQKNQANLLALIENSDSLIYSLDINMGLLAKNTAFERFSKHYSNQPLRIGDLLVDHMPEKMKPVWSQRYLRALEGEKFSVQDATTIDGELRHYITHLNPILVEDRVVGVSCLTDDVTELAKLNQYMISLMDTAYDYIFIKNIDRKYVIASQSLADFYGFNSWRKMIGKRDEDLNEYNAKQLIEEEIRVLEEGLHSINKEYKIEDSNGEMHWLQSTTEPIYDDNGKVVGLSGMGRDITKRKEAERQQRILISSIENSSDFISFLNADFEFIYINSFGIKLLDFEDYEGRKFDELLDTVTFKIVRNALEKHVLQGRLWEAEFEVLNWKTKAPISMDNQFFAIYDDDEGFICYCNVSRDLTERNKLQEEVMRSKVSERIMTATLRAEDKERYRIAHELHDGIQQKIATVNIYLQSLENPTEEQGRILTSSIEKLNEAINEIRNMSHSLVPRALRNSGLGATLQDEVEQLNKNSALKLEFHENVKLERFHQDIELNLYRIFQESTANIFKHSGATTVMIQLLRSGNMLSLLIEDNGKGFDVKEKGKAGFGLSSIQNRAAVIGAHVEIDSVPYEGTSILIELQPDQYES
ncbi:MAG: transporter substrate-binding domain-containing protein [Marinoscillum sp.]